MLTTQLLLLFITEPNSTNECYEHWSSSYMSIHTWRSAAFCTLSPNLTLSCTEERPPSPSVTHTHTHTHTRTCTCTHTHTHTLHYITNREIHFSLLNDLMTSASASSWTPVKDYNQPGAVSSQLTCAKSAASLILPPSPSGRSRLVWRTNSSMALWAMDSVLS